MPLSLGSKDVKLVADWDLESGAKFLSKLTSQEPAEVVLKLTFGAVVES